VETLVLQPVPDLPPELQGKGYIRAKDCIYTPDTHLYKNRFEALLCGLTFFANNPWTNCKLKAALAQNAKGTLVLMQTQCLVGYAVPELNIYDLDGNVLCTYNPAVLNPQDPFPDGKYVGGDPGKGLPFGHPNIPGGPGGGGGLPVTVGGLNVGDIAGFLRSLGAGGDLSGIVQVIAGLVLAAGGINSTLGDLGPGLRDTLLPGFSGLATALDSLSPGLGGRLVNALGSHGDQQQTALERSVAGAVALLPESVLPTFQALTDASGSVLGKLADVYKNALDTLIGKVLALFRDEIERHAPVTPANVAEVAAGALRAALTAGSVAQLSGMGLELLHPLKTLGVQQAIGVLAEFAGFSEIAKPFFSATLRHGIGQPAELRAAAHFRSTLPAPELVRELAAQGLVKLQKYHERLQLAGYPDPYPAAFADIVYTPPNARFLAQLLDGSEADRPWLAAAFRRLGFSPGDADRGVRAAELKTTQPGRTKLVGTLLVEYQHGRLQEAEFDAGLAGCGLSVTHQGYYQRVGRLDRRGYRMELVAKEVLAQYANNLVGEAVVRQELGALGFTLDEITVRLVGADLTRGKKLLADEVKAIEAEVRALKAKGLASALIQLRAGFLDLPRFLAVGEGMGYDAAMLASAAQTALLQGTPKTTKTDAALGLGALEETNTRIAALLAQEVQLRQADRLTVLAQMLTLGLPTDLASILVDLAEAIAGPRPFEGDFGLATGANLGGAFEGLAELVLGGLGTIQKPADLVAEALKLLGLPGRDRSALAGLIRDLQALFHG